MCHPLGAEAPGFSPGRKRRLRVECSRCGVYTRGMQRVNYHLTEKQIAALRNLSAKTGLTVAELIRRAVDAYLRRA